MARKLTLLLCALCLCVVFCAHPADAARRKGGEQDPNKPPPEFVYLDLKPLTVPVITEQGLVRQVSILVSLVVPYAKTDEVTAMVPKLADAYIGDLYGLLGSGGGMLKGDVVDVDAVKTMLMAKTDKMLGPGEVKDVLLQVAQQAGR